MFFVFVNMDGGWLLIGVKDNGKIVGVNFEEEIYMIEVVVEMYCSLKLFFYFCVWQEDMCLVLEISVEKFEQLVYFKNEEKEWRIYVCWKDYILLVNKIFLLYWCEKKKKYVWLEKFGEDEWKVFFFLVDNEWFMFS